MKEKHIYILLVAVAMVLSAWATFKIDRHLLALKDTPPQVDTVFVRDTSTTIGSEPVSAIPDGFELVPLGTSQELRRNFATIAELRDSLASLKPVLVQVHDTAYIAVPMTEYTFTDGKNYEYSVRGYNVTELWHKSYTQSQIITQTRTDYRPYAFSLWPKIGAYGGRDFISASVGIGADIAVSDNRRWTLSPEAGYGLLYVNNALVRGFYGGASIKFNIIQVK